MSWRAPQRGPACGRGMAWAALWMLMALLCLSPALTAAKGHRSKENRPPPHAPDFITRISLGIQPLDGKRAPDFTLPGLTGRAVRLSDFRGKVVFLNFWATWCPACRVEMPAMESVHRRFQNRNFVVLSVSVDTRGKKSVSHFVQEFGITFPVLLDPKNDVMDRFGVRLIPTTFIIGRKGEFLGKVIGPKKWDGEKAIRYFEELLERTAASQMRWKEGKGP